MSEFEGQELTPAAEADLRTNVRAGERKTYFRRVVVALLATLDAERAESAKLRDENAALLQGFPEYGSTGNELREERARAADLSSALESERRDGTYYRSVAGALAERVARLREALQLARDWTEPFRGDPGLSRAELHLRLLAVLAETGGEP